MPHFCGLLTVRPLAVTVPPAPHRVTGQRVRAAVYLSRAAQRAILIPVLVVAAGVTIGSLDRGPLSVVWAWVLVAVSLGGACSMAATLVSVVLNRTSGTLVAKLGIWLWLFTISLAIGKGHLSTAGFSAAIVLTLAWAIYGIVAIGRGKPAA
jgi:hypothetical protein